MQLTARYDVCPFQDIRRQLQIDPFVVIETAPADAEVVQRAVVSVFVRLE